MRKLSAGEQPLTLVFYFFLFGTLVTAPFGLVYWSMPSAAEIGLLAAMGFSGALGVVSTAHAYRVAEASVVAPIDFLRLPLAGVLGVVLFNESFSPYLASGTVVMLTAMYFVVTEPRRGGAPRPPQ